MIGAARRYHELVLDLTFQRILGGGTLAPEHESQLIGALDRCWREMSEAEQDEAERTYAAGQRVDAPPQLAIEDQPVTIGGHAPPRRAAA